MSKQMLKIDYKCLHPSCIVKCREGSIDIDSESFKELSAVYEEEGKFRSPKGKCLMGFSQPFQVVEIDAAAADDSGSMAQVEADPDDPISVLMAEHREVLGLLDRIEGYLRKRDVEALWTATAELEDELTRHSIEKEEQVLFPVVRELMPLGEGLVGIVMEDHVEVINLLYAFRDGLADGEIFDGIINSVITNLKSHIRKEDEEFFELVSKSLKGDVRKKVAEGMKDVERNHVKIEAGDRAEHAALNRTNREQRKVLNEHIAAVKDLVNISSDGGCGCGGEDLGDMDEAPDLHAGHSH